MKNTDVPAASPIQKPRNPFPAWYLRVGTINAADDAIEGASLSCERWEWGCAALVVFSVIVEFVLASIHPSYDSPWNRWGSAIADALIAFGIIGEVLFGRADGRYQTELRERSNKRLGKAQERAGDAHKLASEAEARANEAALELARLRTPRVLTTPQAMALGDKLRPFSGQAVTVVASPRTFEAASLADQIARMLGMAETKVHRQDHWAVFDPGVAQGIAVCFTPGSEKSEQLGIALARLLQAEGFKAESHAAPALGKATPDWVLVIVGEKL